MLLDADDLDGLKEGVISAPLLCGLGIESGDRKDAVFSSDPFWDCLPYSDFPQPWLENDSFSTGEQSLMTSFPISGVSKFESSTPILNDFGDLAVTTYLWGDSQSTNFDTRSPRTPTLSAPGPLFDALGISHPPAPLCPSRSSPRVPARKGLLGWGDTSYLDSTNPTLPSPKSTPSRSLKRAKTTKTKTQRTKRKGSAALALAVVTHTGEAKREAENLRISLDPDSYDPVRIYHEGGSMVKKRKNQPIPVPIPIPNLHKKSRGRKVPFVSDSVSPVFSSTLDVPSSPLIEYSISRRPQNLTRSRRKVEPVSPSDDLGGNRSYICVVPGCGKCFVRGEHLKRHVRSIHTHEKPHACPYEGCDKSFSRRDNLGQHVRVHLQP